MKKRIVAIMLLLLIFCVESIGMNMDVSAEGIGESKDVDYSYFLGNKALFGYTDSQTRGVYLASGDSAISKINSYTIGAAGNTNAAIRCKVSVAVIVEKYDMERDLWLFVTSWTKTNENAFTAGISKSLIVDSGYYYRVRSSHYAGSDASSSCTNALYVGK